MSTLAWLVVGLLVSAMALAAFAAWAWRRASDESRLLARSVLRLPIGKKLRLAVELARDRRMPFLLRLLPAVLVLYLALPLDLLPDFIPVLGQLDDVLIAAAGVALLLRFTPRSVLEENLSALLSQRRS